MGTGRKWNVHKMSRWRPGLILNISCMFKSGVQGISGIAKCRKIFLPLVV